MLPEGPLVAANILPKKCFQMIDLFHKDSFEEAKNLRFQILEAKAAVTSSWGIDGLKIAVDLMGYYGGELRKSLNEISDKNKSELMEILEKVGL